MDASLKAAYEIAAAARSQGRQYIRVELQPRRNYLQRYVRLWGTVIGKTVGRRVVNELEHGLPAPVVDMLIVEVGVTDVVEAFRRQVVEDADRVRRGPESIQANKFSRPQRITTAR